MRSHQSILPLGVLVVCLFALSLSGLEAQACPSLYFDAGGTTGLWDYTTPNWSENMGGPYDQTWIDGYGAMFEGTAGTVNLSDAVFSVQAIEFLVVGYTLNGGTINLAAGTTSIAAIGTAQINSVLSGWEGLYKWGSGTLTLGGANTFTGNTSVGDGVLRLDNALALQNSTVYGGPGMLSFGTLTSATFGGLIGGGDLYLENELAEPVAVSVGNNNQSTWFDGHLYGVGSLIKEGAGVLTLTNTRDFLGDTVLRSGAIALGDYDILQNSTVDAQGGALVLSSIMSATIGGLKGSGDLRLDCGVVGVGVNNQSTTYGGVLSGSVILIKTGSGTLTLAGANTFTGDTQVEMGCLRLDNVNALQNSTYHPLGDLSFGTLTEATFGGLGGGGGLCLENELADPVALSVGNNNQSTLYEGQLWGTGSLVKVGMGVLTLNGDNSNFTGDTVLSDGTVVIGNRSALAYSTVDAEGGSLSLGTLSTPTMGPGIGGLKGSGDLRLDCGVVGVGVNNQSTTYGGVLSGSVILIKTGSGTLTLAGANTFTGDTQVEMGCLRLDNVNALQNSTYHPLGDLSFGTLTEATFGGLGGGGGLCLENELADPVALSVGNNNQSTLYEGQLWGTGSLVKVGMGVLTLNGDNSNFTGDTVLSDGTVVIGNRSALAYSTVDAEGGSLSLGTLSTPTMGPGIGGLKGSGDLRLDCGVVGVGVNNQSTTYGGVLSGSVILIKTGSGTLTLAGANTFTGDTQVEMGCLRLDNVNALQNSTYHPLGDLSFGTLTEATFGGLGGGGGLCLENELADPVALSVGNNNQSTLYEGQLWGTGSLVKVGMGMLTLVHTRDFQGDTVLQSGGIALGNSDALNNSTVDAQGGGLILAHSDSNTFLGGLKGSGNLALNGGTLAVGFNNQSTTYSGVLSGAIGLWKEGSGVLTLGGANTFTGETRVNGGQLRLDNALALQNSTLVGCNLSFGTLTAVTLGGLTGSSNHLLMNELGEPVALSVGKNNQSTAYDGQLSGPGSLIKVGAGTLTLTNTQDFQGDTVLCGGAIALSNYDALQHSTLDAQGGGLILPSSSTPTMLGGLKGGGNLMLSGGTETAVAVGFNNQSTTYGGILSGITSLIKTGSGTLTISGANTFTGTTTVGEGWLRLDNEGALHNSTFAGATFLRSRFGGGLSFGTLTAATFGGLSHSGNTYISPLALINDLSEPVALSVGNNNQSTIYDGILAGPGSLIKIGAGTLTLMAENYDFTGDTVLRDGAIQLGLSTTLMYSTVDAEGGSLIRSPEVTGIGGLKGSGNLSFSGGTLAVGFNNQSTTYSGNLSGSIALDKKGAGTLTLAGANSHTGDTRVYSGVLEIANGMALSRSTLDYYSFNSNGVVSFSNTGTAFLGGLKGNQNLALPNGAGSGGIAMAIGANDESTIYGGALSGTGTVAKIGSGQWMLAGANEHTGTTIVASGEVRLANPNALQSSTLMLGAMLGFDFGGSMTWYSGGSVSFGELNDATLGGLAGGGQLTLTNDSGSPVALRVGNNDQSTTFSGGLGGLGSLVKVGNGTQHLNGPNSYAGLTVVEAGTLEFGPMVAWPVLDGAGADVQGGTLTLDYAVGSPSLASDVRDALAAGQIFCSTAAGNGALGWSDVATEGKVSIMYTLSGDANLDHSVNGTDLNAVLSSYNQSDMGWTDGDFNYDGSVNGTDLNAVLSNYNQTLPASAAAVPEPGMLALLLVAGLGLAVCRRRRPISGGSPTTASP